MRVRVRPNPQRVERCIRLSHYGSYEVRICRLGRQVAFKAFRSLKAARYFRDGAEKILPSGSRLGRGRNKKQRHVERCISIRPCGTYAIHITRRSGCIHATAATLDEARKILAELEEKLPARRLAGRSA